MLMVMDRAYIAVTLDYEQPVAAYLSCFFGFSTLIHHRDAGVLATQCLAAIGQ